MSTNGQLVFTDVDKITFKGVGNTSNAVVDTVTGKIGVGIDSPDANLHVLGNSYVSTNLELGGTLIMGTVNVSAHHSLEAVTAEGNTTPLTVEFSNATTGIVTTGNVEVGKELTVSGNVEVGTANLFVDTTNSRIGIGTTSPQQKLEVHGNILLGQNNVESFIHGGSTTVFSSDADVLIVADSNDTSGAVGSNSIIFGAGSAIDTDNRNFTYAQAYPNDVPRVELMRLTANSIAGEAGRLGVGTASPEEKIHFHANHEYIYQRFSTTAAGTTDKFDIACWNSTRINGDHGVMFVNRANTDMRFMNNSTEWMRIKNDGKVGVGTSSPDHKLHIYDNSSTNPVYLKVQSETYNRAGIILGEDSGDICIMEYDGTGSGDGNYLAFYSGEASWIAKGDGLNFIPENGRVGLGTSSPEEVLHIYRGSTDLLYLQKTTSSGGVGIRFSTISGANANQNGYLRYYHTDTDSYGLGNSFKFTTDQTSETVSMGGSLHIGVDGKDGGYMTNSTGSGRKNLFIQSTYGGNTSQSHGWWIGAQNQGLASNDNDLYFAVVRSGSIKLCGTMLDQNNANLNFTGQHRTFVKDTPTSQLDTKEGLIVVADQNEFIKMSGGVAYGKDAITINESLPLVSLSTKAKDKRCFGVLSTTEDPETRKEVHGNFASLMQKEEGDTRVYVNSVGEGAIWVTDTNGTLESGDYITTSNVAGYGMKQDDDILHNYTVAKILMDCDFNPPTQVKRVIKKEPKVVDYWIRYGDVKINEEEYNTLPDSRRKIIESVHYRIDQMEVLKEDPEKASFVYEQREDMVNVLDEHNEFQWEETDETEKAYKIRYLDADGNITDEANAVHIAAFVGCTYHCG
tara:strand:+ start:2229 stop:4778 length:2550 start_codon:yes stop_codon:yes gene_type:complete